MEIRSWLLVVLGLSLLMLGSLKKQELSTLVPYRHGERAIRLKQFSEARRGLSSKDQELLELWESLLTGRSAPLSRWMKERYQELGLKHLFTPSGFHLSAVLSPLLKLSRSVKFELWLLALVGGALLLLPGQGALKRMVLIKGGQRIWGSKSGLAAALGLDVLFGGFQLSPLSFSYSFLFLGIIYSGLRGAGLALWFFIAQMLLAHFQGNHISPLLLLIGPALNMAFGLALPLLLLLSLPLWAWQLQLGLLILQGLQCLVDGAAAMLIYVPTWEIHTGALGLTGLALFRQPRLFLALLLLLSNGLNLDLQRAPGPGSYEYVPQGRFLELKEKELESALYFSDGICRRKLIRGTWWERCSPRRRSTRRK